MKNFYIVFVVLSCTSFAQTDSSSHSLGFEAVLGYSWDDYNDKVVDLGFTVNKNLGHVQIGSGINLSISDYYPWFRIPLSVRFKPTKHGSSVPFLIAGAELTTGGYFSNDINPNIGIGAEIGNKNPFYLALIHRWESTGIYFSKHIFSTTTKKISNREPSDFNTTQGFGFRLYPFYWPSKWSPLYLTGEVFYRLGRNQFQIGLHHYTNLEDVFQNRILYAGYRIYPFRNMRKTKFFTTTNIGAYRRYQYYIWDTYTQYGLFGNIGFGIDLEISEKIKIGSLFNMGLILYQDYYSIYNRYRINIISFPQLLSLEYNFGTKEK